MAKPKSTIPVNPIAGESGVGMAVERLSLTNLYHADLKTGTQTHRHDGYTFVLLEKGSVFLELDFQVYQVQPSTLVFIHPNQVHRTIVSEDVVLSSWTLLAEHLRPEYLAALEDLMPTAPVGVNKQLFTTFTAATTLGMRISRLKSGPMQQSALKDCCNTLVALAIPLFSAQALTAQSPARFATVYKAFRKSLNENFVRVKQPQVFARLLHLSPSYLNECVRQVSGQPVSYHIQQRVGLEAKRLLVYTTQSVKEIAAELGFDDYPYFVRLFKKISGMTPSAFRSKNRD